MNYIYYEGEKYYQLKDYQRYWLNKNGNMISSCGENIIIKKASKQTNRGGYWCHDLSKRGRFTRKYLHVLLLQTFVRNREPYEECRHLDGNKDNNCLENLCWGTSKENATDRQIHGTLVIGEQNWHSKLNEVSVKVIRYLYYKKNISLSKLGKAYRMSPTTLWAAAIGKTWKHVFYGLDFSRD